MAYDFPLIGKISALLLLIILSVIALLHFSWAAGGKWDFANAVPSKENGEPLFIPSKFSCMVVGVGLVIFAYFVYAFSFGLYHRYFIKPLELLSKLKPLEILIKNSLWIIGAIFSLRGIGDFKYVGLFKKVKNTKFARLDSNFYSPLCLFIALLFFLLNFNLPKFFIHF